ncbi:MAG: hypothetical protein ACOYI5_01165 [Christensenellales bacterium]|jgi:hypothetical protein
MAYAYIVILFTLVAPAVAATALHLRISGEKKSAGAALAIAVLYASGVGALLGLLSIARGNGAVVLPGSIQTASQLIKFAMAAMAFGIALPFVWRALSLKASRTARRWGAQLPAESRLRTLLGGLLPPPAPSETPAPPAPDKPPEAAEVARDERLVQKTEASLAAQEAEMAVETRKIVPGRRSAGAPRPILYNIAAQDAQPAHMTRRQKAINIALYGAIVLLTLIIVYAVLAL